jgi:phosphoglycolate phosphatase/putative hydrolase of the HAD superfamily
MPESSSRIRAVLYDIDGTLYELGSMRRLMALELGRAALQAPFQTIRHWRMIQAYRGAQETLREAGPGVCQMDLAARSLGVAVESIRPVIEEWMERRPLEILPRCARTPVIETIQILARHGIPQAAYSDYPAHAKIELFGVARHFEFGLASSDAGIGAFKPSPSGFLRAAEKLEVAPHEIVYVGDREEVDGAGARAAGMHFVHVDDLTGARVVSAREADANSVCRKLFGV